MLSHSLVASLSLREALTSLAMLYWPFPHTPPPPPVPAFLRWCGRSARVGEADEPAVRDLRRTRQGRVLALALAFSAVAIRPTCAVMWVLIGQTASPRRLIALVSLAVQSTSLPPSLHHSTPPGNRALDAGVYPSQGMAALRVPGDHSDRVFRLAFSYAAEMDDGCTKGEGDDTVPVGHPKLSSPPPLTHPLQESWEL